MRANGCGLRRYSRERASSSSVASSTRPARRRTPRCRLVDGRLSESATAISPERSGRLRKSRTTRRRAGSPSARKVASRLVATADRIPEALVEPPLVAFEVLGAIAAVHPVLLAVIVGLGRLDDGRARGPRPRAVGPHLESEGAAEPVDRRGGIVVEHGAGHP